MTTRAAKMEVLNNGVCVVTWEGITEADDGAAVSMANYPDKSVQAVGDFDASGAITVEGSNDGTNWATLTNQAGENIVLTAATMLEVIAQNPLYVRPRASAGTAVAMNVILVGAPRL